MTYQAHQAEHLALKVPAEAAAENVTPPRFKELTGISPKGVYNKIARGDWLEGYEYHRSRTGAITIYLPGYYRWARGQERVAPEKAGVA